MTGTKPAPLLAALAPLLAALVFFPVRPQESAPQEPQASTGASTGGTFAPVRDALNRPITAGGFVADAPVIFEDVTEAAGLAGFVNRSGSPEKLYILEVPTGGVALFDYDRDGWLDIYLVSGSTFGALEGKEPHPRAALYRNDGDGTFTDVTGKAGVENLGWAFGVAVSDFDNDGWEDLFVTNFGANRLYRNNGDGTFTDVAAEAGVALGVWSTAAAFADYNRDGHPDLFVTGYLKFDRETIPRPDGKGGDNTYCQYRGHPVMCGPRGLPGERDFLFRSNGDGTFTEVAEEAGVSDPDGYYGFAATWVDVDDDGWVDLVVANDSTPNYLYRNKGDGTFEDLSYPSGIALNENGREQACMAIAAADFNHDGRVDLYMTNFSDDYNTLYENDGDGYFLDVTFQVGLGETTIPFLGWGAGFIDYDNDGHPDLFVANGHVYPGADEMDWGTTWKQRPLLFRNLEGKRFEPVPAREGSGLATLAAARGAAFGDLDNDGRIDVVLNNMDSPPVVLRSVLENGNHWVSLRLIGGEKSGRDAVGAAVFLTAGGFRQRGDVLGGDSYSSHSDRRVHFGLGTAGAIEKLEIRWPSGRVEFVELPGLDRTFTLAEGRGVVDEQKRKKGKKKRRKK